MTPENMMNMATQDVITENHTSEEVHVGGIVPSVDCGIEIGDVSVKKDGLVPSTDLEFVYKEATSCFTIPGPFDISEPLCWRIVMFPVWLVTKSISYKLAQIIYQFYAAIMISMKSESMDEIFGNVYAYYLGFLALFLGLPILVSTVTLHCCVPINEAPGMPRREQKKSFLRDMMALYSMLSSSLAFLLIFVYNYCQEPQCVSDDYCFDDSENAYTLYADCSGSCMKIVDCKAYANNTIVPLVTISAVGMFSVFAMRFIMNDVKAKRVLYYYFYCITFILIFGIVTLVTLGIFFYIAAKCVPDEKERRRQLHQFMNRLLCYNESDWEDYGDYLDGDGDDDNNMKPKEELPGISVV